MVLTNDLRSPPSVLEDKNQRSEQPLGILHLGDLNFSVDLGALSHLRGKN